MEVEAERGMGRKALALCALRNVGRKLHWGVTSEYRLDLCFGEEANLVILCLLY